MKYAVVGSRTFKNTTLLATVLNALPDFNLLISGGAVGADTLAGQWAKTKDINTMIFLPEWEKYGKAAGPMRNTKIVEECDELIAFWDGVSRGTLDSITKARALGKKVHIIKF